MKTDDPIRVAQQLLYVCRERFQEVPADVLVAGCLTFVAGLCRSNDINLVDAKAVLTRCFAGVDTLLAATPPTSAGK